MCYNKVMDIWTRLGRYASFETERMYLRPFTYKDSQDFFEICSNPDNLRFIFPSRATREESDFVMVYYFMKEPLGVWAIEDKKTHKMIGCIRFEKLDPSRMTAEIDRVLKNTCFFEFSRVRLAKFACDCSCRKYSQSTSSTKIRFSFEASIQGK